MQQQQNQNQHHPYEDIDERGEENQPQSFRNTCWYHIQCISLWIAQRSYSLMYKFKRLSLPSKILIIVIACVYVQTLFSILIAYSDDRCYKMGNSYLFCFLYDMTLFFCIHKRILLSYFSHVIFIFFVTVSSFKLFVYIYIHIDLSFGLSSWEIPVANYLH